MSEVKTIDVVSGNRLVAEFMGGWIKDETLQDYYWKMGGGEGCSTYNMQYHASWDWLMPVVDKIEELEYEVYSGQYTCMITNWMSGEHKVEFRGSWRGRKDHRLQSIYSAIVQFITWYNTH